MRIKETGEALSGKLRTTALWEKRKTAGDLLLAFVGTCGVSWLMNLRDTAFFSFSIFSAGLYAVILLMLRGMRENLESICDGKQRRRRLWYVLLVGMLFSLSMVMGYQLQWRGYTDSGVRGKILLFLRALCVLAAAAPFVNLLFAAVERCGERKRSGEKKERKKWKAGAVFGISYAGIQLSRIPVWLAYYPIIMSYDFHRQSVLALNGFSVFGTEQPLIHTLLIWAFRNLGTAIGSYQTALALFSLLQQLILSAVLAYACAMVYRMTEKKRLTVGAGLFFALFPLVSVFAMCTTKDVLFGAFFLLFLLLLAERFFFSAGRRRLVMDVLIAAESMLMVLFRGNAWYALLPFAVLLPLVCRKGERLRALAMGLLLVLLGKGALAGIQGILHAGGTAETEKYGAMIECMHRVGYLHGDTMPEETRELLRQYVPEECWPEYNAAIVDGVKTAIAYSDALNKWERPAEMLADWITIGLQYPNEYLDAFLEVTRGYWFWDDTSHAEMLGVGTEERMGLLYTYNSYEEAAFSGEELHESKFPWLEEQLEKLVSANLYYRYPVVSNLFKPAFWIWATLFLTVVCFYRKQKEKIAVILYPICYFATLLMGPTAIIRYVFPIMISVPVIFALVCHGGEAAPRNKTVE